MQLARALTAADVMPGRHWVTFHIRGMVRGVRVDHMVTAWGTGDAPRLYDEAPFSAWRRYCAQALRKAKSQLGFHPCTPNALFEVHAYDWCDAVDTATDGGTHG